MFDRGGGDPKNVSISRSPNDRSIEGKNLAQITRDRGLEPNVETPPR
jgi:hypothetical protein